jgi:hypothetical protein
MCPAHHAQFPLHPHFFGRQEELLLSAGPLSASGFCFATGVAAVRLRSDVGEVVVLPFQGQHVWSARFGGRELGWHSMVHEPRPHVDFLSTFGGMLQHCGLLAIGGPGPGDTHAVHGELPNAPFQEAWLEVGSDDEGPFIGVGGEYRHAAAFGRSYAARPTLRLRPGETLAHVSLEVENRAASEISLFYLSHINFRPVDGGRLVYSAPRDPAAVRARTEIPSHITPKPGYRELLDQYRDDPLSHETLLAGPAYDPEVVFFIDYTADADGFAHTLQLHPDGSADYVRHRPTELPIVTRWISRTPDQDAIAMAELGTAEPLGVKAMMERGMALPLAGGATWRCAYSFGMLPAGEASETIQRVEALRAAR